MTCLGFRESSLAQARPNLKRFRVKQNPDNQNKKAEKQPQKANSNRDTHNTNTATSVKANDQTQTINHRPETSNVCAPMTWWEKEPEKFDGKAIDWKDYIVHFEKTAAWNQWSEIEKAQQLSMSLRGVPQKLLGDLSPEVTNDYTKLKDTLAQRFNPKERVTAYRCEFRTRTRRQG